MLRTPGEHLLLLPQSGRAPGGEHQARQQAMADLQRQAKQPSAAALDDQPEEGSSEGDDRPSEWAGFIYNPYSGDVLPPEDDEDGEDFQSGASSAGASGANANRARRYCPCCLFAS